MLRIILATGVVFLSAGHPLAGSTNPKPVVLDSRFDFGRVVRGTPVRHGFVLENRGSTPLVVTRVTLTAPLIVERLPRIAPGQRGVVPVVLDTSALRGPFDGELILSVNNAVTPELHASFVGEVFEAVELSPLPGFFVATTRNRPKEQAIDIINHESQPLHILNIQHSAERFATRLDTVEGGQHYRLTLRMPGTGPAGRYSETILVRTSSASQPLIRIRANTWLRERVYAFPEEVDFGTVPLRKIGLNSESLEAAAQTLMIYQVGGKAFDIKAHSDNPHLAITAERGMQGDRWELTVRLLKGVPPGVIKGSIAVTTNDPDFAVLTVPVRGTLLDE